MLNINIKRHKINLKTFIFCYTCLHIRFPIKIIPRKWKQELYILHTKNTSMESSRRTTMESSRRTTMKSAKINIHKNECW